MAEDRKKTDQLIAAASDGNAAKVLKLIKTGVKVSSKDKDGFDALLSSLNSSGYKINNGQFDKWIEVIKILLENGADINTRYKKYGNRTALIHASELGILPAVKFLFESGADIRLKDQYEASALHRAALYGHYEVVKFLLENGAEVSSRTEDGETPLKWAKEGQRDAEKSKSPDLENFAETVRILKDFGAR